MLPVLGEERWRGSSGVSIIWIGCNRSAGLEISRVLPVVVWVSQ
jgi:hypothetical protein